MFQKNKPRKVHIDVTESGKKTADIRMPFGMFRLGLRYGKQAASEETDACAQAMARLVDFDCASFARSVAAGEIVLPYQLLDMFDTESQTNVMITVEG